MGDWRNARCRPHRHPQDELDVDRIDQLAPRGIAAGQDGVPAGVIPFFDKLLELGLVMQLEDLLGDEPLQAGDLPAIEPPGEDLGLRLRLLTFLLGRLRYMKKPGFLGSRVSGDSIKRHRRG